MKRMSSVALAVAAAGLLVFAAGCFVEKDAGHQRAHLLADKYIPDEMDKWIAVPDMAPKSVTANGITYYVLGTHNVVPDSMAGFIAMNPKAFEKYTGIKPAGGAASGEPVVLKARKKVLRDQAGWVALPSGNYPAQEKDGEFAMANLEADQLVPKEMDGWAAVDKETVAKLAKQDEMNKNTMPGKKK